MNNVETVKLMSLLNNIDDENELDSFLDNQLAELEELKLCTYLEKIFKEKGLSKSAVIKNADIDRTYGYEILRGNKKPSRDKIIQLCIGANFTLEETNRALKLGNVSELYPKIQRDSVIMFGIKKSLDILDLNTLLFNRDLDTLGEE